VVLRAASTVSFQIRQPPIKLNRPGENTRTFVRSEHIQEEAMSDGYDTYEDTAPAEHEDHYPVEHHDGAIGDPIAQPLYDPHYPHHEEPYDGAIGDPIAQPLYDPDHEVEYDKDEYGKGDYHEEPRQYHEDYPASGEGAPAYGDGGTAYADTRGGDTGGHATESLSSAGEPAGYPAEGQPAEGQPSEYATEGTGPAPYTPPTS
jgi:hypothetical protein